MEAITNRTAEQEAELKTKKQELAELEKQQSQEPKKTNWTPWIIGGGIILVLVIVIVYLLMRDSGKRK